MSGVSTTKYLLPSDKFEFVTKPYQHQIESFNYAATHEKFLLGDEQGLGKTKQAIDIAVYRKKVYGLKHCLIVCGNRLLFVVLFNKRCFDFSEFLFDGFPCNLPVGNIHH